MTRGLVALATLCICAAPTGAQSLNAPARGIADSLSTIGDMEFTNGWLDSAEAYYDRALAVDPSHGRSTVGLARLSLAADSVDAAERLFALAEEREPDVGHIQYGRGLLALRDGEIAQARYDFEAAVIHDRLHADALLELALIKRKTILGRHIVDRAYRKAIEAYPQHPRSHLEYGRYKREAGFTEEAIELFRQQLEVYPRSGDAHIELGSLLLDGGQTWHARRLFMNAFEVTLRREVEICLLVAATYMADRQFPMARDFYAQALEVMAPQDRSLFEDISPIAGLDLAQRARDLTGPERVAFLERFWLERDPTPITPINERLLEHLRRVSYSRIHFSQHVHPWDDRGTVYVRYGEPDHRTTSSRPNLLTPRGVEVVRERYLRLLYGSNVPTLLLDSTQPAYPLDDPANLDFDPNSGKLLGYFPGAGGQALGDEENTDVIFGTEGGSARKRWEVWTYSSLGRGTQFTFADPTMGGTFSFAQPPPTENQHLAARLVELAPAEEFDVLSRSIPDRYAYDTRLDPLNFYYYTAQFRARANQTRIDVCYGIPLSQMMFRERDGEFSAVIESGVAVYDTLWNVRGRTKDRATLRTDENPGEKLSAIQTDMRSIYMPGGDRILLSVQAEDVISGRLQTYQENLRVSRFDSTHLSASDILLATSIRDTEPGDAPKFVRDGRFMLPLASLTVQRGEPVHVYFEIYNLMRGPDYGETQYEIEHAIHDDGSEGSTGILGSVGRILGGSSQTIGVEQVVQGVREVEHQVFELETADLAVGRHVLVVTIHDLKSGERVTRRRSLRVVSEQGS